MPAAAQPVKPPVVQGNVIALYAQGKSKRSIAKDLGIARATVDSILTWYSQTEPVSATRVQQLVPLAYDAVEQGLRGKDARLGLDFLKATELAERRGDTYQFTGDTMLVRAVGMLPAVGPGTPSTPSLPGSTGTTGSTGTEAAAKPPGQDMSLSSPTNFSNFSDEQLEQELARRRAARAQPIDAEVVSEP